MSKARNRKAERVEAEKMAEDILAGARSDELLQEYVVSVLAEQSRARILQAVGIALQERSPDPESIERIVRMMGGISSKIFFIAAQEYCRREDPKRAAHHVDDYMRAVTETEDVMHNDVPILLFTLGREEEAWRTIERMLQTEKGVQHCHAIALKYKEEGKMGIAEAIWERILAVPDLDMRWIQIMKNAACDTQENTNLDLTGIATEHTLAYRKLAMSDPADRQVRLKVINAAYDALSRGEVRLAYDLWVLLIEKGVDDMKAFEKFDLKARRVPQYPPRVQERVGAIPKREWRKKAGRKKARKHWRDCVRLFPEQRQFVQAKRVNYAYEYLTNDDLLRLWSEILDECPSSENVRHCYVHARMMQKKKISDAYALWLVLLRHTPEYDVEFINYLRECVNEDGKNMYGMLAVPQEGIPAACTALLQEFATELEKTGSGCAPMIRRYAESFS